MRTESTLIAIAVAIASTGCSGHTGGQKAEYVFGLIAKSQNNPVFVSCRVGAEDAAADLSKRYGAKISVRWQTPNEEDAQKQVQFIEQLVNQGVDAIGISCTNADTATPAIDAAEARGIPVMCFDSDAPRSKRFCYHGTNDVECGRTVMRELATVLGPGRHTVAVPGGNQNALNIQNRVRGALEEAKLHPDLTVKGVYYSKETAQDAAAKLEEVQTANPDIDGWAMVGSWALFTDALMKWRPGQVKFVAMDALPVELPYLRKGIVSKLFAQQTYRWGYRAMEIMADKVLNRKDPPEALDYSPLVPVTLENVDVWEANWKKWLHG